MTSEQIKLELRFKCKFCPYSKTNKDEKKNGQTLKELQDHVRKFHDRTDYENSIEEIVL